MGRMAAQKSPADRQPQGIRDLPGLQGIIPGIGCLIFPKDGLLRHAAFPQHIMQERPLRIIIGRIILSIRFRHAGKSTGCFRKPA